MARWILKLTGYALLAAVFALCLYSIPPTIETEVLGNAKRTLQAHGIDWALVSIDGRDITLSGSPPSRAAAQDAVRLLSETTGVRTVRTTWPDSLPAQSAASGASIDMATIVETPTAVPTSAGPDQLINLPVQQAPDQEFNN